MRAWLAYVAIAGCTMAGAAAASGAGEPAARTASLARMPIREISVFKDGHAFVVHQGAVRTTEGGRVVLDALPSPVLGTFWPYSAEPEHRLTSVVAGSERVQVARTALTVRELLEGNVGAKVTVTELTGDPYPARIVDVPQRAADEIERTSPPNADPALAQRGTIVLLETAQGTSAVPLDRIRSVTFAAPPRRESANEEFRGRLTMAIDWGGAAPPAEARVGMAYVQKGIRWIPGYRVALDGHGKAEVRLQATLVNELADLEDVTANLVVGVPTFAFRDIVDPMGLQQVAARLSPYFQQGSPSGFALSNSIQSQLVGGMGGGIGGFAREEDAGGARPDASRSRDTGPELAGADRAEDLFVFAVKHVTLKKGQRMVIPVNDASLAYRDVYVLDVPITPPLDARFNAGYQQQAELARMMAEPKVEHRARITNAKAQPLTTAPALVLRAERVLGQGTMTYTARGGEVDLAITAAPDIRMKRTERETRRTPNALVWNGNQLGRIDMEGVITLTNSKDEAVAVEVSRSVLGIADEARDGGSAAMLNAFEDNAAFDASRRPAWWGWYEWPQWWSRVNGIGRFTWTVRIPAGKSADLHYSWHWFATP